MDKGQIKVKTPTEIEIMIEGGKKLGDIKRHLTEKIKEGVSAEEIEKEAVLLIKKTQGKAQP